MRHWLHSNGKYLPIWKCIDNYQKGNYGSGVLWGRCGVVRVIGRDKLLAFGRSHANAKKALDTWFHEADKSEWKTTQDIRDRYGSADFLADNRVIFNIKGNHYRLVVKVRYQNGIVAIEWVGTHAEYSKKSF